MGWRWLMVLAMIPLDFVSAQAAAGASNPAATATNPDYILTSSDTILVSVTGEPELTTTQLVDATGSIRLPLIGDLKIDRLKVRAAEALIAAAYKEGQYLRSPEIRVHVVEYAPRFVTVMGAVRNTGKVMFPRDLQRMEILDVITQSGGLLPVAKGEAVVVTRPQPNGTETTHTIDVANLMSGKKKDDRSTNFSLQPGDRVFIPERLF